MRTLLQLLPAVALVLSLSGVPASAADKKTPEEKFMKLDSNGDGKLSPDEFVGKKKDANADKAKEQFKAKDKDGDGFLTLDEFKSKQKGK